MVSVGYPVLYSPHAEHDHLVEFKDSGLAAIVGRIHDDGTADLHVMVPNKPAHWQDAVPYGEGPHTFRHIGPPERHEIAEARANLSDAAVGAMASATDTRQAEPVAEPDVAQSAMSAEAGAKAAADQT